jgi:hypothetical protein
MHVNFGVVSAIKSLMCDEFAIPNRDYLAGNDRQAPP